jgi:Domain of unknown function (DUF4158)
MKFGQNPLNLCARCPWSFRAQHKAFRWLICQHSCCNPNWRAELVSASSQLCAGTGVLPPLFRQFAGQILKNRPRTRTRHRLLEMGWLRFRGQVLSAAACANSEDQALINRRRGDPNRLGFALMLCYLRFPGRILQQGEQPPAALCAFVAEQLGLDAAHFGDYAERDQTRREHVLEIETALGLRPLTHVLYRELAAWLLPTALAPDHAPTLVATLLEELRARRIVCPSLPAIERLAGSVRARAQRQLWRRLADGLTDQQRQSLD